MAETRGDRLPPGTNHLLQQYLAKVKAAARFGARPGELASFGSMIAAQAENEALYRKLIFETTLRAWRSGVRMAGGSASTVDEFRGATRMIQLLDTQYKNILVESLVKAWEKTDGSLAARNAATRSAWSQWQGARGEDFVRSLASNARARAQQDTVITQALEQGGRAEKRNIDMKDNKVEPMCIRNSAAGWIPAAAPFPSGKQGPLYHFGCRCKLETRIVKGRGG